MTDLFFFFNDTATTEIYTLSLHDALPISFGRADRRRGSRPARRGAGGRRRTRAQQGRSEEHTSELQSQSNLVCRLLLEKKKKDSRVDRVFFTRTSDVDHETAYVGPTANVG